MGEDVPVRGQRFPDWVWYLSAQLVAAGVYFLLPDGSVAQGVVFLVAGFAVAPAILAGIRRNRPDQRGPWYLLTAGAILAMGLANVIWYLWPVALHRVLPYPSIADGLYLTGYGVLLGGLVVLVRARAGGRDRAGSIDTAIITIGLAVLSWVFLISPNLQASGLPLHAKLTSVSYPLVDVLFVAVLVRVAVTPGRRTPASWLLSLYMLGQLSADTAYGLAVLDGSFRYGHPMFAGWLLSYGSLGAAALHPSMRALSEPVSHDQAGVTRARMLFLAGAALLAPAIVAIQAVRGQKVDHVTLSVVSAMVFVLVIARLRSLTADISQLRQAEEAARESEAALRAVFAASPDIITMLGPGGQLGAPSPAVGDVLGYGLEDYMKMDRLSLVHPEDREQTARALRALVEDRKGFEIRYRIRHADEHWVMLETRAQAMADQQEQPIGAVAVSRDVTERVALEQALLRARDEADRANRAKSEFLSRMSHELRTPLNAILGFGQLLEMDGLDQGHAESVRQILKGGRHLLDLINEVLDIARVESGRLTMSPEPILLANAVGEAIDLIRPLAAEQRIQLRTEDAWPADGHVTADRQRLKQVLLNLLSNAVKYNRQGGTVTVRCRAVDGGGLRVEVRDDGPGIHPELMERLFVPFERLGAEATDVEGTGLGLALSRGLIEAMGGSLGVESAVGRGSTFFVHLLAAEAPGTTGEEWATLQSSAVGAPPGAHTILYVDDNLANLKLIEGALHRRPGLILLTAMQASLGLHLARQHQPDLILLDLHLPDIPGQDVLGRLQGDPRTRDIPVIVISADTTPGQIRDLLAAGAHGYLTKPIDVPRFFQAVDEALEKRRLHDAS